MPRATAIFFRGNPTQVPKKEKKKKKKKHKPVGKPPTSSPQKEKTNPQLKPPTKATCMKPNLTRRLDWLGTSLHVWYAPNPPATTIGAQNRLKGRPRKPIGTTHLVLGDEKPTIRPVSKKNGHANGSRIGSFSVMRDSRHPRGALVGAMIFDWPSAARTVRAWQFGCCCMRMCKYIHMYVYATPPVKLKLAGGCASPPVLFRISPRAIRRA
jgi:hypothetical protein